jgi:uncharacterized protein
MPEGGAQPKPPTGGWWRRQGAALARWLHIYLSMASFGILFFFAVTGLTLNHADWFYGDTPQPAQSRGRVERAWVKAGDAASVAKLEIVEHLRSRHRIHGALAEFRVEDAQCAVSFRGPGYNAEAFINRETGEYELSETRMGWVAVLNDLHKGRDSGRAWSWVIDLSAGLMVLVSLTGLILLLFLRRRRASGLWLAAAGAVVAWLVYYLLVP